MGFQRVPVEPYRVRFASIHTRRKRRKGDARNFGDATSGKLNCTIGRSSLLRLTSDVSIFLGDGAGYRAKFAFTVAKSSPRGRSPLSNLRRTRTHADACRCTGGQGEYAPSARSLTRDSGEGARCHSHYRLAAVTTCQRSVSSP